MREYSGNFDLNTISALPRWIGRIVSTESWQGNIESAHFDPEKQAGWGGRYKVRIYNLHSPNIDDLPDEQLPMANVILPVTAGSGINGFVDTPALSAGSLVTGFFLDGMGGQEPYIDGVLINSNNSVPNSQPKGPTGGGQLFGDGYYGTNAQTGVFIPSFFQTITKIKRPSFASTEYRIAQQSTMTIDELRARTAAREEAGPQVGDVVTGSDAELVRQEQEIGRTGNLPAGGL